MYLSHLRFLNLRVQSVWNCIILIAHAVILTMLLPFERVFLGSFSLFEPKVKGSRMLFTAQTIKLLEANLLLKNKTDST